MARKSVVVSAVIINPFIVRIFRVIIFSAPGNAHQLNELETEDIDASIGGLTLEGESTEADREDIRRDSLGQKSALDQAPSAVDGHFQVPKIL